MAPDWILLMLVLIFSTSWEAQSDTGDKLSSHDTYNQNSLPYTGDREENPHSFLVLATDEGQQKQQVPSVTGNGSKVCVIEKCFSGSATVSSEGVHPLLPRGAENKSKFLKILIIQNTMNVSVMSSDAAPKRQILGGVVKQEFKECDLILAYEAEHSQPAVLTDLLLLPHAPQVGGLFSNIFFIPSSSLLDLLLVISL